MVSNANRYSDWHGNTRNNLLSSENCLMQVGGKGVLIASPLMSSLYTMRQAKIEMFSHVDEADCQTLNADGRRWN